MKFRVRFAPSPTGYLHIGGARTCFYNYLMAKHENGPLILRIEDTDLERSSREFENEQIADFKWLGIEFDESPNKPGDYGPYRQSERTQLYLKTAQELIQSNNAFYCFCSDQELESKKEQALAQGKHPHYDGTCYHLSKEDVESRISRGQRPAIRFKAPFKKYAFSDLVRGDVEFPEDMVGDFVIIRSNGMPTYNYCCVIDDALMDISHVIRAEEHLNNTVRQLMIYEALGKNPPAFAHVSLLIGKDRQKLSKRHGATSVRTYREEGYFPEALLNYLTLLGWSHPEEKDVFTTQDIVPLFDFSRFSKSPAVYDVEKLNWINGQHMKAMETSLLEQRFTQYLEQEVKDKSGLLAATSDYRLRFLGLFKDKADTLLQLQQHYQELFKVSFETDAEYQEMMNLESTPKLRQYLLNKLSEIKNVEFVSDSIVGEWMDGAKKELGIKGKPLFMGTRVLLTGRAHGPDLKVLLSLTPVSIILQRLSL